MVKVAAQLLGCSLFVFGVLSVWCAKSKRHWFLRCCVFLVALFPLFLIPAYEPAVAFAIQGMAVCAGFGLASQRKSRWRIQSRPPLSFGITVMFQAMAILAVAIAVGVKSPRLNAYAWCNVFGVGFVAGIWTCVANWIVNGKWKNVLWRLLVGVGTALLISLPIAYLDTTLESFVVGWPASPDANAFLSYFVAMGREYEGDVYWIALAIGLTVGWAVLLWLLARIQKGRGRLQWISIAGVVIASILILVPPLRVLSRLLNPTPFPRIALPPENGYEDLLAAGKIAEHWDFNGATYGSDQTSLKELKSAVAEMEAAYSLLEQGLAKQVEYPLDSFDSEATSAGMAELRSLARASIGRGRLASREGDFVRAAKYHRQTMEFGHRIRGNGLMIHYLVGMACSGTGYAALHEVRDGLPLGTCLDIVSELRQLELGDELFEDIMRRDEAWTQRADGWHGHLHQILAKNVGEDSSDSFRDAFFRELATMRLLRTEFALVAFQKESGEFPRELNQLIPRFLKEIPVDPYSDSGESFQYRIDGESYVLYSLGANRDDDGGLLPEDYTDSAFTWGIYSAGDLRLEYLFSSEPDEVEESEGDSYQPDDYFEESDP